MSIKTKQQTPRKLNPKRTWTVTFNNIESSFLATSKVRQTKPKQDQKHYSETKTQREKQTKHGHFQHKKFFTHPR